VVLTKINILRHLLALRHEEWLDHDSMARLRDSLLLRTMRLAYRAPYYRRVMDGLGLSPEDAARDISSMPLLQRDTVGQEPESLITQGHDIDKLSGLQTSGSTGNPIKVYIGRPTGEYRAALGLHSVYERGISPSDCSVIITRHGIKRRGILDLLHFPRRVPLYLFDDDSQNLERMIREKATILGTVPSTAAIMASLNNERGRPLKLKRVVTFGEVFRPGWRDDISESFSCPVYDVYGSTELFQLARECPQEQNMHVCTSSCLIEIVDGKGRPKRSGRGEIVATSLQNHEMPLVRYRIGDEGEWGSCPCGRSSPVLKYIAGRADDMVTLPSGTRRSFSAVAMNASLDYMRQCQTVQEREDLFVVRYVPGREMMSGEVKKRIADSILKGCLGEEVSVEFEAVDSLPRGSTGKIKNMVSKVKPPS
jgi:phenylacetate-CoA ligase